MQELLIQLIPMFMFLMMKALATILERIDLLSETVGGQPRKTDPISHR
jgi:hypothetical protein